MEAPTQRDLRELGLLFLRLGATAFGGPAAHVALMERELVDRRGWLTRSEFLDLLSASNLIPGPNSTELAMHVGQRRAGLAGLCVAGVGFILPAFACVLALSWAYVAWGTLPVSQSLLYGVKPVVLAVVLQALLALAKSAVTTRPLALLGLLACLTVAAGVHELLVLLACGLLAMAPDRRRPQAAGLALVATLAATPAAAAGSAVPFSLGLLMLSFLKAGATLFGSGYVLLAFLRADFVERLGWLSEAQLLDAIAVGQVTPGPLFTSATFVGYLLAGPLGACVATAAIFLPAFVFVGLSAALVPRLRGSPRAGTFLDGVNVGSLALMAVVTLQLGSAAVQDLSTLGLVVASTLTLLRFRPNPAWLMLGGGLLGWALQH